MIDPRKPDYSSTPFGPNRRAVWYSPESRSVRPLVTVVTPFYNLIEVFHETASSVLGQSIQDLEWLIINDGSTEPRSLEILERYRRDNSRIRVIDHDHNRGLSAARNTGYCEARTEFIFQLDGDDLIEPTTLEKCFWFLLTHPDCAFVKGFTVGFGAEQYLWSNGFHDRARMLEENMVTATAMVRRSIHSTVGGYGESIRGGMEDWDFWLRCAANGYWGATVPEYLDWYRRREDHWQLWDNIKGDDRRRNFVETLRQQYPRLWETEFPPGSAGSVEAHEKVETDPIVRSRLSKPADSKRLLMILPRLTCEVDSLRVLESFSARGWETTIVTTDGGDHAGTADFSAFTSDVFPLHHFLELQDYPRFLRYLMESRQPDVVLLFNSELAYLLLPYLRCSYPNAAYVDFSSGDGKQWSTSQARHSVASQHQLDMNIVSCSDVREMMAARGADPARIEVCRAGDSALIEGLFDKAIAWKEQQPREIVSKDLSKHFALRAVEYVKTSAAAERLTQERDSLRETLKVLKERSPDEIDPSVLAHEIIQKTYRYKLCDQLNDLLKRSRLHTPIKRIMKVLTRRK